MITINHPNVVRMKNIINGEALITQEGRKSNQFLYGLVASLGALVCGCAIFWTPPKDNFKVNVNFGAVPFNYYYVSFLAYLQQNGASDRDLEPAWHRLTFCFLMGCIIGALPTGYVVDRFGRKVTLVVSAGPWICSWMMLAKFDDDMDMLYVARFLCGIVNGMVSTVVPMYLTEIAENSIRGLLGTMFQMFLTTGFLFVGTFVDYVTLNYACAVLTGVSCILFCLIPESPVSLVKKNVNAAKEALRRLRGPNYKVDAELQSLRHQDQITSTPTVDALTMCIFLMVFMKFCGMEYIISNAVEVFSRAQWTSTFSASTVMLTITTVQILAIMVAGLLVDRIGRKRLLITSGLGMAVCLTALAPLLDNKSSCATASTILIIVFTAAHSVGLGPLPWIIPGELFPPRTRGRASGVIVAAYWMASFLMFLLSSFVFDDIVKLFSISVLLMTFAVISVISAAFAHLFLPETMGQPIKDAWSDEM